MHIVSQPCGLAAVARSRRGDAKLLRAQERRQTKEIRQMETQREEMEEIAHTFPIRKLRWDLTRVSGDHTWPRPVLQLMKPPLPGSR